MSFNSMSINHCRFCGDWRGEKVKYSVRHEAHLKCALAKQGMKFIRKLIEHPGLRWKLQDHTVAELVVLLPEKEQTINAHVELNELLGRSEDFVAEEYRRLLERNHAEAIEEQKRYPVCATCEGKGFLKPDGSKVNSFEGLDSDPVIACPECNNEANF